MIKCEKVVDFLKTLYYNNIEHKKGGKKIYGSKKCICYT